MKPTPADAGVIALPEAKRATGAADYLALVDPATFQRPADFRRDLLVAGALRIGKTRLIDNIFIDRKLIP